jgi:hypothetical protein
MADDRELDLILTTRLDVLEEAVKEVDTVIKAMEGQKATLAMVADFLDSDIENPSAFLLQAENRLLEHLNVMRGELEIYLRSVPAPPPPPSSPDGSSEQGSKVVTIRDRMQTTHREVERARAEIAEIATRRSEVQLAFRDVDRWSVASLNNAPLQAAAIDYRNVINEIRRAKDPWRRYESEIPRRGHVLFGRYLELVAGIAVRGFGLGKALTAEADDLINHLIRPLQEEDQPRRTQRSPLALMGMLGKRHFPLGYPEWSLWALPLVGRTVGDLLVTSMIQREPERWQAIDSKTRVLCADLYAQFVLGPSYLHAAVFLEFDPAPEPMSEDAPPDTQRAALLMEKLPELEGGTAREVLTDIAERIGREWRRARLAVGGEEQPLTDAQRAVVEDFLTEMTKSYPYVAFEVEYMEEIADRGRQLAEPPEGRSRLPSNLSLHKLICAMWLARLEHPKQARRIHEQAKKVARSPGPPPSVRSQGPSQSRAESWGL